MLRLMRLPPDDRMDLPTVSQWLEQERQPPRAIERFWQVVLVSALGESLQRASLAAARKVFLDGFLAHPDACDVYVPRVPLNRLYDGVAAWLAARGIAIRLESPVAEVAPGNLQLADGTTFASDHAILAVPWRSALKLLSPAANRLMPALETAAGFASAPITGVHLWFDRPLTDLPHAVLVGRMSQWIFARRRDPAADHYYQVVISASHDLAGRERQSVIEEVLRDLRGVFRRAQDAQLLRWQMIHEQDAVFSVRPGLEAQRPPQVTPVPGVYVAGDWTRTGWPATMEGAVRSGYLAASGVLQASGQVAPLLVDGLPRSWLVKGLGARD
jgi:squalene-associated FAD-dependent desaturase